MSYSTKDYEFINLYNASFSPSQIHAKNTGLTRYFSRYLLEKVFSVFEFENIPDGWDMDYFRFVLFINGKLAIFNTDKFGIIPNQCEVRGYNIYYQPTHAIVTNPLIKLKEMEIGTECAVVKLTPEWLGCWDLISYYAEMLALVSETTAVNLINSKFSYVFLASNKQSAESMKKLYDDIASGIPSVYMDRKLLNEDGTPNWIVFNQNVKQNYISDDLLADMHRVINMFNTDIGIPNANYEKSERLITDEVNANNVDTQSKIMLWKDTIQHGFDIANKLFDLNLNVKLKFKYDNPDQDKEVLEDA